jgi:dihydrolipoamide dehydrogenase
VLRPGNVVEVESVGAAGGPPAEKIATYQAKSVIIATGSVPIELPFLKFDETRILSNVGALIIPKVPEHLVVVGGGVIGLGLGSVWNRLGAKVTVVELMPTILPGMDDDVIKEVDRVFRKQGLDIRTNTKVVNGGTTDHGAFIEVERDGKRERIEGDHVLVSVGRRPSTNGIDTKALGLDVGKRGEILVDDQMRTNLPNVYAIGDCVPGLMLSTRRPRASSARSSRDRRRTHYQGDPNVVTLARDRGSGSHGRQVKESGREYRRASSLFSQRARVRWASRPVRETVADAKTDECGATWWDQRASSSSPVVLGFEYRASSRTSA